jgi:MFS family permease
MTSRDITGKTRLRIPILLFGIGVSSIGDFIYLVALNIFVYNQTHSVVDVAGMWVVARVAALVVGPWAGSITDRFSHRKQLIGLELARAMLIGLLPFQTHLFGIYIVLFLLGVCSTFFGNAFLPYQTLLVPGENRKRVNAWVTMLRSGSILLGPAIAGLLLQQGQTSFALWLDAASFLVSGVTLCLLPEFHSTGPRPYSATKGPGRKWSSVKSDWQDALNFLRTNGLYTWLLCMNTGSAILGMSADSQEVVFAQDALHLGQLGYGMMVVAAGVGYVLGSLVLSVIAKKVRTQWLIAVGSFLGASGYLIYAFSYSFWWAVAGLVILGLFGSAAGVGFTTFTQHTVPITHMGRINNVLGPPQQVLSICFILLGGYLASGLGVRAFMLGMTIPMCVVSLVMAATVLVPRNRVRISQTDVSATIA